MRDVDIRRELDAILHCQHSGDGDTLIRHEVGLCANERRIDIAVFNGEISGYEIKSDADTLNRLFRQAGAYGRVLDRVTLVTTLRHLEKAVDLLPSWWGVVVAKQDQGHVILKSMRKPCINTELDPFSLAQLLWRSEALEELKARGLSKGLSKKARHYIWLTLAEAIDIEELRVLVRERVKVRPEWLAGQRRVQNDATRPTVANGQQFLDQEPPESIVRSQRHRKNSVLQS